ncbi:MAG: hypothetical protein BWY93_00227 [Euryarchaeota archaeon ADurb.BinA087]|nr:MAG: hypothetical protein BWY93_00227 [Euryarchaeota archaeon ADurb.BinA087]HQA80300.1 hypothetical protein [Methanoregulaceae archaeon]
MTRYPPTERMRRRMSLYYTADQVLWGLLILAVLVFLFMIIGRRLLW